MARYGDIEIFVTEENPSFGNYSTDQPTEDGDEITDHVRNEPDRLQIRGKYAGPDAGDVFSRLLSLRRKREPKVYAGRNYLSRMVIEGMDTEHDRNIANGFRFTMRLKQIKVSKPSPVKQLDVPERTQAKPVESKGRQNTATKEEPREGPDIGDLIDRPPLWDNDEPEYEPTGRPLTDLQF